MNPLKLRVAGMVALKQFLRVRDGHERFACDLYLPRGKGYSLGVHSFTHVSVHLSNPLHISSLCVKVSIQ